jgi:hypothetical protein
MRLKNLLAKNKGSAEEKTGKLSAYEQVTKELEKVPESYNVFCDVDTDKGKIDFVIETDQGAVMMVETNEHKGKVSTDGTNLLLDDTLNTELIPGVLAKTEWLKGFINQKSERRVWVHSALVFANARLRPFQLSHVNAMNSKHLLKFIEKHKADKGVHMSPGAVRAVQKFRPDFLK